MALKKEQCEQLQEKLTAANTPEKLVNLAHTMGYELPAEDAAGFLNRVNAVEEMEGKLTDEQLLPVHGGKEEIPQYQLIKDYYKEKGPNLAFVLCIYYIPSPICYEIIQVIENEAKNEPKKPAAVAPYAK